MKWFRLYSSVLNDPKVQRLSPVLFKHWINILCVASENEPRGELPCVTDLAFALRIKPTQMRKILASLGQAGVIDTSSDGKVLVHNWTARQRESDNIASRVEKHRARKHADSGSGAIRNVTLHETLQKRSVDAEEETDTDRESISSSDEVNTTVAVVDAPQRAAAATTGWTENEVKHISRRIAGRLKMVNPDMDALSAILQQHPCAAPYLEAEAAKCQEWHSAKGRKVTIRLFDNWLAKAETRQEQERLQQQALLNGKAQQNGSQQSQPTEQQPATPSEHDLLHAYHQRRAAEAEAARAKMVS